MGSVQGGSHPNGDGVGTAGNGAATGLAGATASKLSTMVQFPLEGFDMSPNVADRANKQMGNDADEMSLKTHKDRASSESKNSNASINVDNKFESSTATHSLCTESPRVETKEIHRNGTSSGATGTLKVFREKCA
jgi:hypothetical protein